MSESEKLTAAIAEYERETTQLTADVEGLTQRLVTATTTAEQAIAAAERRADDTTQATAVDAEQERQRLAAALTRKRLALVAATADLQAARHALTEAKQAALLIQLQTALDGIQVAAGAIDVDPMAPELWAELWQRVTTGQSLYRQAGGTGRDWIQSPQWARSQLFGAYATRIDWALGGKAEAPKEIPMMATLLGIDRAAGLVRELMGAN